MEDFDFRTSKYLNKEDAIKVLFKEVKNLRLELDSLYEKIFRRISELEKTTCLIQIK
jgi:hypothetical protein